MNHMAIKSTVAEKLKISSKIRGFPPFTSILNKIKLLSKKIVFNVFCHKFCHEGDREKSAFLSFSAASLLACSSFSIIECRYTDFMTTSVSHPPSFIMSASGTPRDDIWLAK